MTMRALISAVLLASSLIVSGAEAEASSFGQRLVTAARARNAAERESFGHLPQNQGAGLLARASALQKGLAPSLDNPFRTPDLEGARNALERALEIDGDHWAEAAAKLAEILLQERTRADTVRRAVDLLHAAAERKERAALTMLGKMYLTGKDVPVDRRRGQQLLTDGLTAGDPEAAFELARMTPAHSPESRNYSTQGVYLLRVRALNAASAARALARAYLEGAGVPVNQSSAEELYRQAAELGEPEALTEFAELIIEGKQVNRPVGVARSLLETAVFQGSIRAAQILVHDFLFGRRLDVPAENAILLAEQLDQAGDPRGSFYLYVALSTGSGVDRNTHRADDVVGRLVTPGRVSAAALLSLGRALRDGDGVPQNPILALPLFRAAADAGHTDAMHDFAEIALKRASTDAALPALALEFLERAVQADHLKALVLLGDAYRNGWGVPRSLSRAGELYDRAIQLGDLPTALERRAEILLRSGGGSAAALKGEQLLARAASKGNAAAMLRLGRLYLDPQTALRNPDQGVMWLEKAQAAGNAEALQVLAEHFSSFPPGSPQRRRVFQLYEQAWNAGHVAASVPYARLLQERHQHPAALEVLRSADARGHIPATVGFIVAKHAAGDLSAANDRVSDAVRDLSGQKELLTDFASQLLASGVPVMQERASELLDRLAQEGQASAAIALAAAYRTGINRPRDPVRAEALARRAAELGAVDELFELAFALVKGHGLPAQPTKAAGLLEEIHKISPNHVHTLLTLAGVLREGNGVRQDVQRSVELLRAATREGSVFAALALANAYVTGSGVPRDPVEAKAWFEAAASGGSLEAILALARSLVSGDGPMLDPERAFSLYRRAAEQGAPEGVIAVGRAFMSGFGVVQDVQAGLRWLERAAAGGSFEAMYDLFLYHANRPGGDQDALHWIRRAAEVGSGEARFRLAMLHRDGRFVRRSEEEMMRWLKMAAETGHEYSGVLLGRVARIGSTEVLKPTELTGEDR